MKILLLLIISFTSISIYPQKLFESFEGSTFPPAGWTSQTFGGSGWSRQLANTSPPPGWTGGTITVPAGGGNAVAFCTYSSTQTFNEQWLITPQIPDVQATDTLYFAMRKQFAYADTIFIGVSESTNSIANFSSVWRFDFSADTDTNWFAYAVPIGELVNPGANIYIAFIEKVDDNNTNGAAISIDLVYLEGGSSTYPSTIQLNKALTFGNPANSSSYRMIGLPGNVNTSPAQLITGTHKQDWNLFRDNGAADNFFEEFDGSAKFNFGFGRGFWILSRNTININRQVNTLTLEADNTYSLPLHSGWNIITNPFERNVSFTNIRNANTGLGNAVFYSFNGSFSAAATMVPYEGYYFMNPDGRGSLSVPYPFGTSLPKLNTEAYTVSDQNLKMRLSSAHFSSEVIVGIESSSSNNYDAGDYFAPPGNFEELGIRLVNKNLSTPYKELFIEHRPEIGEGQSFKVNIKNTTGKLAILAAEGIDNFNEYEVYLVDERLKKFFNLKEQNEILISGSHKKNEFSLLIGKQHFIDNYADESNPADFKLYQNYPNPFNPATYIRYEVPEKEHITIKVYDILGNLVDVLVDEVMEKGFYEAEFNGSSLSSGIYFYEFTGGSVRTIKKMTLLK